jgi:NAD-dependent SIR2 family protein deacetylase
MMQSDFVISLHDMRYVEIHCSHCSTVVTMDMARREQMGDRKDAFAPMQCPGCATPYDSKVRPAVDEFKRAYQSLMDLPKSITFRGASSREKA